MTSCDDVSSDYLRYSEVKAIREHHLPYHPSIYSDPITRGQRHSTPGAEIDIAILRDSYKERRIHEVVKGREIKNEGDFVKDWYIQGTFKLNKAVEIWGKRRKLLRSKKEDMQDLEDLVR